MLCMPAEHDLAPACSSGCVYLLCVIDTLGGRRHVSHARKRDRDQNRVHRRETPSIVLAVTASSRVLKKRMPRFVRSIKHAVLLCWKIHVSETTFPTIVSLPMYIEVKFPRKCLSAYVIRKYPYFEPYRVKLIFNILDNFILYRICIVTEFLSDIYRHSIIISVYIKRQLNCTGQSYIIVCDTSYNKRTQVSATCYSFNRCVNRYTILIQILLRNFRWEHLSYRPDLLPWDFHMFVWRYMYKVGNCSTT